MAERLSNIEDVFGTSSIAGISSTNSTGSTNSTVSAGSVNTASTSSIAGTGSTASIESTAVASSARAAAQTISAGISSAGSTVPVGFGSTIHAAKKESAASGHAASKESTSGNAGEGSRRRVSAKAEADDTDGGCFTELYSAFSELKSGSVVFDPTGSIMLDQLLGGGMPRGRTIEMFSEPGTGKTHIAAHLAESILENTDGKVLYLEPETALLGDVDAQTAGVNVSDILRGRCREEMGKRFALMTPQTYEDTEKLLTGEWERSKQTGEMKQIRKGFFSDPKLRLVIIDSITQLLPGECLNKPIGDWRPGIEAQYQSAFFKKYKALAAKQGVTIWFITQLRVKLNFRGVTTKDGAGGFALKHGADVRIKAARIKSYKDEQGNVVAGDIELQAVKNKVAGNNRVTLMLEYGKGVNNLAAYANMLGELGHLKQRAGWYDLTLPHWDDGTAENATQKAQGRPAVEALIKSNLSAVAEVLRGHVATPLKREELLEADGE